MERLNLPYIDSATLYKGDIKGRFYSISKFSNEGHSRMKGGPQGNYIKKPTLQKPFILAFAKLALNFFKLDIKTFKFLFNDNFFSFLVSYCHHLASVVVVRRKLFQRSFLKLLDQLEPNLV